MKKFDLVATLAVLAVAFGAFDSAHALEQAARPLIRDSGGTGAGDPSLGGTTVARRAALTAPSSLSR